MVNNSPAISCIGLLVEAEAAQQEIFVFISRSAKQQQWRKTMLQKPHHPPTAVVD
jgi:hypothetical protein